MRKVFVTEFMTADGVMEDPGGAEGFEHGGWSFAAGGEEDRAYKYEELFAADALLLGRKTYEGFAAAWPRMGGDHGYGDRMNNLPKHVASDLVLLRDPKLREHGEQTLQDLAERVTDRNFRVFAERGLLHVINGGLYLRGTDPFTLFEQMQQQETIDPSHAFYLGYEMAKAVTALTLGKNYVQDQALRWGFLTVTEPSHRRKITTTEE